MRLLTPNETVIVEGARLISEGNHNMVARVSSINKSIWDSNDRTHSSTVYGMVLSNALAHTRHGTVMLKPRQYFCLRTPLQIESLDHFWTRQQIQEVENVDEVVTDFTAFAVEVSNYEGLETIGLPCEEAGRLKYIDGCSDTLLISPPVKGEPCFNLLYFPEDTDQTMHTHPSLRCGMTIAGNGIARFPDGNVQLTPGSVWFLETEGEHAFMTEKNNTLLVTAWHPDSDFGPTHDDHPMLNRTIVEGVSAKYIDNIRTK